MDAIRLLLVDDEIGFRQTLARRLEKRGVVAAQAGGGEEALSILESHPVEVIVLDVKMPGMNGIETLQQIKEKFPSGVEVILLTGHSSTQDGVVGIKAGAFDYLSKPIEFDHLFEKIRQACEKIQWEKEKAEEAAYRAKMEQHLIATERLASLGTLSAGIAHEINNPLAIIKESAGWLRTLLKKDALAAMPMKEQVQLALEKIETSVERAKKITHQLLGFARKGDSIIKEVSLDELAAEVMQLVANEAKNKDVALVKECGASQTVVWTDPYQVRQVLINLVNNAIQATDRRGKVTIGISGGKSGVQLEVADTGSGIPKENLERIFEPFFTTKPPGEGTGLGLSVSRGIIEKLGGTIDVESQLSRGSTFRIALPRHHATQDSRHGDQDKPWLEKIKHLYKRE